MVMRISTASWFQTQSQRMQSLQGKADALNTQISTGKRLADPSSDPLAAHRANNFSRLLADQGQFERNIATASLQLETSTQALGSMSNVYLRLGELALSASSETLAPADRVTIGQEVAQLKTELLALANTRNENGQFVFAGSNALSPAYIQNAAGQPVWMGGDKALAIPVGPDITIRAGDTADDIFENILTPTGRQSAFALLDQFSVAMQSAVVPETPAALALRRTTMETVVAGLQTARDRVTDVQSSQGVRLARLESEQNRLTDLGIDLTAARAEAEDTDISKAVVEMQRTLLILQASQASFGQLAKLSLFDVLR
jgi:flagellar hook-associated protein 3 FlgL